MKNQEIETQLAAMVATLVNGETTDSATEYGLCVIIAHAMAKIEELKGNVLLRSKTFGELEINFRSEEIKFCPFNSETSGRAASVPNSTHGLTLFKR
jgi:hypothetical protein